MVSDMTNESRRLVDGVRNRDRDCLTACESSLIMDEL
jgi:hypothetical protein